ncbi:hypothetical protein KAR91_57900, partial [Candidatus Pacearchaeota archaeon]|nr:hypothetical protein [Candidatus Pacearchaeota archaeon]
MSGVSFKIAPHPKAPQFKNIRTAQLYLNQLLDELDSPNFNPNVEAVELFRQASLVNLWFWLRIICSYNGPFQKLDNSLSLEMCNFRQESVTTPGDRAAMCISRGFYKSTIATTGGNSWEMRRDPDIKIIIFNAVVDKAYEFMHITQRIFDSNELVQAICPDFKPGNKWNDKVAILANRSRYYPEPT